MSSRFGSRTDNGIIRDFIESYDADAQAYFTANTAITSPLDKRAMNDFYLGLKSDGIYTKIKAMYLPIWGSAASSKWNLINNRTFDLSFATGWTFSSGGMTPNGSSAYAETYINPSVTLTTMSQHISYYSRTNNTTSGILDNGCQDDISPSIGRNIFACYYSTPTLTRVQIQSLDANSVNFTETNSLGLIIGSRTSSTSLKAYRNNTLKGTNTTNSTSGLCGNSVFLGGFNYRNNLGTTIYYGIRQCSFATIGDGLTDTEATRLYNRVNTLMGYFGINVTPVSPIVSDADAQAYINANDAITSQSDANEINTFFTGLKSDGIYTKMKAMYLPIWGSATSSKWNLVNPLDTDAAFRLSFANGVNFTSGGMTSNGTSGYADTWLNSSTDLTLNNTHISFYSRTNNTLQQVEIGCGTASSNQLVLACNFQAVGSFSDQYNIGSRITTAQTDSRGLFLGTRTSSSIHKLFKNGSQIGTTNTSAGGTLVNLKTVILGSNVNNIVSSYSTKQCSFASIGNGLTDTEAKNFSNRVNTLMAYFGINTYPVVSDADAQAYINANDAITNQSDANAINTFFTGLKLDGIYTKMKAMYLPIWGSAASSKWNLVNNRTFDLSFSTGWTFSSGGMTPLNAYANTNLKPSINLSQNNTHLSYYSRTNNTGLYDIGHSWTSETSLIYLQIRAADGKSYFRLNSQNAGGTESSQTIADSLGLFTINRTSSTVQSIIKNSTKYNFNINSFGLPNNDILLGLLFINPNNYYGNKQCAFSSIGDGLTDTEATNFYNRVQTLMTYFGINV